jgi:hypothetical protein
LRLRFGLGTVIWSSKKKARFQQALSSDWLALLELLCRSLKCAFLVKF